MGNWYVASRNQILLLLVLICLATGSTGAAFSLEEEFLQLKGSYIQMKEVVKSLESKVSRLESKDVQMQEKLTELEAKVQQQDSLLTSLLREKNERTAATDFNSSAPVSINQSAVAINGLPSSCGDLKTIGHIWNGIYFVMGSSMMESIYCDFTKVPQDAGFQKWIGYADVKSEPVHFYVQKNTLLDKIGTIPFELARLNVGNAMNLTSGIFSAPRPGIYFFSFTGIARKSATVSSMFLQVGLYLNGGRLGLGHVEEPSTADVQLSPLTLQSTLNLKLGDQVWVDITVISPGVTLFDNGNHYTHFTGFMLEEEIGASL